VVKLRRWIDMADRGWYSGDTHTHRSLDELPNVMRAEDLNVAFPLLDWVREAFVPPVERREATFRDPGPATIRVDDRHLIVPRNTEYEIFTVNGQRHTLGAFFVINHKSPLDLGVPPVAPVALRARREGALIELDKHNWPWSMALVPVMPVDLFELSNNHVWRTDFGFREFGEAPAEGMKVERDSVGFTEKGWIDFGFQNYYALLNCGYRLRPTAGTASGVHPVPLGFGRVYVHLDGPLDADAWLAGLNAGRSFVTTGPMLMTTLNGVEPGRPFRRTVGQKANFQLAGTAESQLPLDRIEVVVNGEVVKTLTPANRETDRGSRLSPIEETIPIDGSSWIAIRCFEKLANGRERFAHSAPVFIDVEGKPLRPRRFEVDYLIQRVESQIKRSEGVLPAAAIDEYRDALKAYRALAETAR
ncbi:MAG: CehA/McbA family metallohydrolase, partial [Isosphaeraceae bacterium]